MLELIVSIIFIISILGTGIILYKKIPVLVDLPFVEQEQQSLLLQAQAKIAELDFAKFNFRKLLENFFEKFHNLIFKIENKIGSGLETIKKNRGQKNQILKKQLGDSKTHNDNYWQEIKKHKENNNK